jgi:type II secretory pathway component PulC
MRSSAGIVGLFLVGLFASACGGAAPAAATPTSAAPRAEPKVAATPGALPTPANSIRRSQMQPVLQAGPGAFLQRVTLDEQAVFQAGRFHGFRVQRLNDATFFQGVDLKAGDVVTHINGFPIEHPEEALEAFKSLEVSSELRVEYEREGVPRELRFAIIDDDVAPAPAAAAPAPATAPKPVK